jgi:hypothetical protein
VAAGPLPWSSQTYEVAQRVVVVDIAGTADPIVHGYLANETGGGLQDYFLWPLSEGMDSATRVYDLFDVAELWDVPAISDLESFAGGFYAFLQGDIDAQPGAPSLLYSADGRTWARQSVTVSTGTLLASLTPESPPWPGASAVTDAAVGRDRLWATGWVTTETGTSPAVWSSDDGRNWSVMVVDNLRFDDEYGSRIAVGDLGILLDVGGPVHSGVGTLFSPNGTAWTPVAEVAAETFTMGLGVGPIEAAIAEWTSDGPMLRTSPDGITWAQAPMPEFAPDQGYSYLGGAVPVIFTPWGNEVWVLHDDVWREFQLSQATSIVVTDQYLVATGEGIATVYLLPGSDAEQ